MKAEELATKRWLRQLREASGLSQAALAEAVGTSRRTVLNAESEREDAGWPNGFTLLRMLQELGAVTDAPAPAATPLARLEAGVAELADDTGRSLEAIAEGIARIEERLPDGAARARKAQAR